MVLTNFLGGRKKGVKSRDFNSFKIKKKRVKRTVRRIRLKPKRKLPFKKFVLPTKKHLRFKKR